MGNKRNKRENLEPKPIETEIIPEEVEATPAETEKSIIGIVSSCGKLNVRETPTVGADVVCVVSLSDMVLVDLDQSTDDFYKVTCANGVEGFCMKDYITIQE